MELLITKLIEVYLFGFFDHFRSFRSFFTIRRDLQILCQFQCYRKINFFGAKDLQVAIYQFIVYNICLKNASLSEKTNFWH